MPTPSGIPKRENAWLGSGASTTPIPRDIRPHTIHTQVGQVCGVWFLVGLVISRSINQTTPNQKAANRAAAAAATQDCAVLTLMCKADDTKYTREKNMRV